VEQAPRSRIGPGWGERVRKWDWQGKAPALAACRRGRSVGRRPLSRAKATRIWIAQRFPELSQRWPVSWRDQRSNIDAEAGAPGPFIQDPYAGWLIWNALTFCDDASSFVGRPRTATRVQISLIIRIAPASDFRAWSMIRKSGSRFSEKIMRNQRGEIMMRFPIIAS
jgi:hypothetical protein